jgi:uncharacterized protein YecE (DUF72 family)
VIHIGTSGYSYDDWVGAFYPSDVPKNAWLAFYAHEFSAVEINFTYYRLPDPRTLGAMAAKTPPGFLFTVKASQELTHTRKDNSAAFAQFVQALGPLISGQRFGCVLAQFPYSFHPDQANRDYLITFREHMGDLPVVVEFRNAGWLSAQTFALLRDHHLGFCCVDEPRLKGLIPPIAEATGSIAYVRFHGRNAQKWWQHEQAWERYDYTYVKEELQEWVPKIRELDSKAQHTFLFANNHWEGQAVDTARQLRLLLA